MKKILIPLMLFGMFTMTFAQKEVKMVASASGQTDCKAFSQFKKGFKTQMTSYDKKDKVTGVVNQEIIEVGSEEGDLVATCKILTDEKFAKGRNEDFTTKLRCHNGNFVMNFRDMMGSRTSFSEMKNMEMKITGDNVEIPYRLSVGQTLPESTMNMEMIMNGASLMTLSCTMKDRVVEKKETISSSAGNFDCYKITYKILNSAGMGEDFSYAIWMENGLTVKTATYDESGKAINYTLLTKLEKP
jgi:hypothetical protein